MELDGPTDQINFFKSAYLTAKAVQVGCPVTTGDYLLKRRQVRPDIRNGIGAHAAYNTPDGLMAPKNSRQDSTKLRTVPHNDNQELPLAGQRQVYVRRYVPSNATFATVLRNHLSSDSPIFFRLRRHMERPSICLY